MSESNQQTTEEVGVVVKRTLACDLCSARKVKCDRQTPCSACVASKVSCRTTKRLPTRRKRASPSRLYEQGIENVNRTLADLSTTVQTLVHSQDIDKRRSISPATLTPHGSMSNHFLSDTDGDAMPYEGDTSFSVQSRYITNTLGDALSSLQGHQSPAFDHDWIQKMLQEDAVGHQPSEATPRKSSSSTHQEIASANLPPMPLVLRLIKVIKSSTESWLFESQIVSLSSFTDLCQNVYFPTEDYTIFAWIIVNAGLFHLFRDCDTTLSEDKEKLEASKKLCKRNVETAIRSLPLIGKASVEACQALMLAASLAIEDARISFAWKLTSTASRMCLDLGLHRMPQDAAGPDVRRKRMIFWNILVMDKGLAFNFGMTPTIHDYDITTDLPSAPGDLHGLWGVNFLANIEFAILEGEIYAQLFSAAAQKNPQEVKEQTARAFASRLRELQSKFTESQKYSEDLSSQLVQFSVLATEIMILCLLTIVYRVIPPTKQPAHPLQFCDECIETARTALAILFQVCTIINAEPESWHVFINWTLLSIPFVPFIVLFGNAIAQKNHDDLTLLRNTLTILASAAERAPAIRKLYVACTKLTQLAEVCVAENLAVNEHSSTSAIQADYAQDNGLQSWHSFPMMDQDWARMLNEMDLGLVSEGGVGIPSYFEPMMNGAGNVI